MKIHVSQVDLQANTSSVDDMLDDLDWPSLEDRRLRSSLAFFTGFTQVRCLLTAPRLGDAGASRDSRCAGYMSYGDALGGSFFPGTILLWNGLPSSVVASRTAAGGGGGGGGVRALI